jgi:hypothetical protein
VPRQVFVRSPLEQKPVYVDFDSPFCVNVLAKAVRRLERDGAADAGGPLTLTEMSPRPDQAWLVDGHGHRYTSEIRLVATDLRGQMGGVGQRA